jgi:hypothetical protein
MFNDDVLSRAITSLHLNFTWSNPAKKQQREQNRTELTNTNTHEQTNKQYQVKIQEQE